MKGFHEVALRNVLNIVCATVISLSSQPVIESLQTLEKAIHLGTSLNWQGMN